MIIALKLLGVAAFLGLIWVIRNEFYYDIDEWWNRED